CQQGIKLRRDISETALLPARRSWWILVEPPARRAGRTVSGSRKESARASALRSRRHADLLHVTPSLLQVYCFGVCTAAGAAPPAGATAPPTAIGAWATTGIVNGTSSSTKLLMIDPAGTRALVPVMKKPAGRKTIAETATAPMPPATPLSSNAPLRRIWRPLTVT